MAISLPVGDVVIHRLFMQMREIHRSNTEETEG